MPSCLQGLSKNWHKAFFFFGFNFRPVLFVENTYLCSVELSKAGSHDLKFSGLFRAEIYTCCGSRQYFNLFGIIGRYSDVFEKIKKRDGRVVEFDSPKITAAIAKAGKATGEFEEREARKLTLRALTLAHELRPGPVARSGRDPGYR